MHSNMREPPSARSNMCKPTPYALQHKQHMRESCTENQVHEILNKTSSVQGESRNDEYVLTKVNQLFELTSQLSDSL